MAKFYVKNGLIFKKDRQLGRVEDNFFHSVSTDFFSAQKRQLLQ